MLKTSTHCPLTTVLALCLISFLLGIIFAPYFINDPSVATVGYVSNAHIRSGKVRNTRYRGLVAPRHRTDLGTLLDEHGYRIGAELGVHWGGNAKDLLEHWKSCKRLYLVDIWKQQKNYKDLANQDDAQREADYQNTIKLLSPWSNITVFMRMFISEAAKRIPDESLDFVYVDARHDYCGVSEDIGLFWPKVRVGGLMAGHDYMYAADNPTEGWNLCANGTNHPGAVKGAVDDFANQHGLQVSLTYKDGFPSWIVRKTA